MMMKSKSAIVCIIFYFTFLVLIFSGMYWMASKGFEWPENNLPYTAPVDAAPKDNLPHAKMPVEFRTTRLLELDIGQTAWIGKYCAHIDEKSYVWIDSEGDVYIIKSDASWDGSFCFKLTRVVSHCVVLILLRSHQK